MQKDTKGDSRSHNIHTTLMEDIRSLHTAYGDTRGRTDTIIVWVF